MCELNGEPTDTSFLTRRVRLRVGFTVVPSHPLSSGMFSSNARACGVVLPRSGERIPQRDAKRSLFTKTVSPSIALGGKQLQAERGRHNESHPEWQKTGSNSAQDDRRSTGMRGEPALNRAPRTKGREAAGSRVECAREVTGECPWLVKYAEGIASQVSEFSPHLVSFS